MKRRNFINTGIVSGIGLSFSQCTAPESNMRKRGLRVAHITDMHIYPDPVPEKGIRSLVNELNQLKDKPDFLLNTGDNVMDSLKHSKEETAILDFYNDGSIESELIYYSWK
jgi:3',5'-cyclic-AMP phosphodiesterase